ncbi:MAG: hypothetical protein WCL37_07995 [Chrysiogenales bacterium]
MKFTLLKAVILIPFITLLAYGLDDQQTPVTIKEFLRVVNVELIVRVSDHGQPVSGLQKSDFRLSEDGQALEINGFSEFHRTLASAPDSAGNGTAATMVRENPAPRLLILYFWILEPGSEYEQALDYFFKAVYRTEDRVLLVSPQRVYEIGSPDEIASRRQALAADIDDFTRQVVKFRRAALTGMQTGMETSRNARNSFNFSSIRGNLTPLDIDMEQFRKFAASLKNLDMEKWVMVFCQRNLALFSSLSFISSEVSSPTRFVQKHTRETDLLSGANSFSSSFFRLASAHKPLVKFKKAEMEKMFIQCGATFHLLVLESKQINTLRSEGANYIELQTGWQDVFAAISSATGGMVLQEAEMAGALQKFSQLQDIYYVLTYEPSEKPRLKRKVKLELPGRSYDLFYNNEGVQRHIGKFAVSDLEWQEPLLKLKLENYLLELLPQGIVGHITLTIRVVTEDGDELTSVRKLFLPEKKPEIQLKLQFPKKGSYHLFIEAVDLLGPDMARAEKSISWLGVPAPALKPEKKVGDIVGNESEH